MYNKYSHNLFDIVNKRVTFIHMMIKALNKPKYEMKHLLGQPLGHGPINDYVFSIDANDVFHLTMLDGRTLEFRHVNVNGYLSSRFKISAYWHQTVIPLDSHDVREVEWAAEFFIVKDVLKMSPSK